MKKNIIIVILIVTNPACLFFAFAQKVAADEQRELAVASAEEAIAQRQIAGSKEFLQMLMR